MTTKDRAVARSKFLARYGEWAVVTGASSGIGRELVRQLSAAGLNVVAVARTAAALDQLTTEITAQHGVKAQALPMDLATPGAAQRIQNAVREYNVGLLVNAAGFGTSGPLIDSDVIPETEMLDVNCRALLKLTHGFGKRFSLQRRGGIILLSSILAFQGVPRSANYSATKAYVQSLGEGLADELKPYGVDVLLSAPGPTYSGFAARAGMHMNAAEKPENVAQRTIASLGRKAFVVPGRLSKLLHGSLMTLPRFARVRIMKEVMKSMT